MATKIVAITGSYRRGHIIDSAVAQMLESAEKTGAQTSLINLLDKHIEFCTNCRKCAGDDARLIRGKCVIQDDLESILQQVDEADGIILASPTNFYTVTALMKKFIERLVGYGYWPWDSKRGPVLRIRNQTKKAVVLTSTAAPSFPARIAMPGSKRLLKIAAKCMGAKTIKSLHFGLTAISQNQPLTAGQLEEASRAGRLLAQI